MSFSSNKYPCPKCDELADRINRRLVDRVVSLFKPVKRYKCHFCDWTESVSQNEINAAAQRMKSGKSQNSN